MEVHSELSKNTQSEPGFKHKSVGFKTHIFFLHSSMIEMDHPFSNKLWLAISIPHTQISMETNLQKKGNLDRRSYFLLPTYPTDYYLTLDT